jgi:hypothetical protein
MATNGEAAAAPMTVGQQAARVTIALLAGSVMLVLVAAYVGLLVGIAWWAFESMLGAVG